jgi:undecaprenyl-diphosphatase
MEFLQRLLQVILHNPYWAYGAIFLVSLSESLAVIGLVIPGTVVMFGIGAVVASGSIGLLHTLIAAIAGAIVGDGISYWLGHHYHRNLTKLWPFSRYPQILVQGEAFFHRHGGKSVLLGRFVGPVRPVIPVIAGMLGMEPRQFYIVNVLSAIGWAIAYILPGVLFGTSLAVAGAVSIRLAILILLLAVVIWGFVWMSRRLVNLVAHHGPLWFDSLHEWIASDSPTGRFRMPIKYFFTFLFVHQRGEEILMGLLVLIVVFTGWGFLEIFRSVLSGDPLAMMDEAIHHVMQSLRMPWADHILVVVTEMGDSAVNLFIIAVVAVLLVYQKCYRTAGFWLFTTVGGSLGVQLLKWLFHLPRPMALYHGISAYGFPSGHTSMSAILYGFLAILISRRKPNYLRWQLFIGVFIISFAIAFSRLYLGAHWFSDVMAGFLMGTCWAAINGIAYLKSTTERVSARMLAVGVVGALMTIGVWHVSTHFEQDIVSYAPRHATTAIPFGEWKETGWRRLPGFRVDLEGEAEQPLTLQLAGNPQWMVDDLTSSGWQKPTEMDGSHFLKMLSPDTPLSELPILPRLHDGRLDRVRLVRQVGRQRWVLRLWPSNFEMAGHNERIFLGTIEIQDQHQMVGMILTARDSGDYDTPVHYLSHRLGEQDRFGLKAVDRAGETLPEGYQARYPKWSGATLLIWDRSTRSGKPPG